MRYWFNEGRNELFAMEIPPIDLKDCIEVAEADYNAYMEIIRVEQAKAEAAPNLDERLDGHDGSIADIEAPPTQPDDDASTFYEQQQERAIARPLERSETASVDMEKLARVWRKMQDARDKLSHDFKLADLAIENQQDQIGAAMLAAMNAMKGTKLTTAAGVVEKKTSMKASGSDWGAIQRFIIKHGAWELLHKRLGTRFIEDWSKKHDGELPPGISVYTEFKITVTKPGSKEVPRDE